MVETLQHNDAINPTSATELNGVANEQSAQTTPDAFFDIELPVPPGIDWILWFEWVAGALLALLFVIGLVWLATQFGSRLAVQNILKTLKHHLRLAANKALNDSELLDMLDESKSKLYQAWQQAHKKQLLVIDDFTAVGLDVQTSRNSQAHNQQIKALHQQIQQSCFSKNGVSRETLLQQTLAFEALLAETKPSTLQSLGLLFKQLQKWLLLAVKLVAPTLAQRWEVALTQTTKMRETTVQNAIAYPPEKRSVYVDSFAAPSVAKKMMTEAPNDKEANI